MTNEPTLIMASKLLAPDRIVFHLVYDQVAVCLRKCMLHYVVYNTLSLSVYPALILDFFALVTKCCIIRCILIVECITMHVF